MKVEYKPFQKKLNKQMIKKEFNRAKTNIKIKKKFCQDQWI